MVGSRGFEPRSARSERAASANCATSRWSGANGGIRTRTSRLGRPAGNRYPTFALVRPTGIEPVPPRWQRGMHLHTQAEHGPVSLTGPSTSVSCQRPRSFELVGGKGIEPNRPLGENGVTARQRTIRSYRPCWRQLPASLTLSNVRRQNLLATWPVLSRGLEAKTKKAF